MRLLKFAALAALALAIVSGRPAAAQPSLEELDKRLREELPPPPPGGDAPQREPGFLGLFADDAETPGTGVEVISVHPGGPAEVAGIKRGDLITSIEGKAIRGVDDMGVAVAGAAVGKKLRIEVTRDGKRSVHAVTPSKRLAEPPRLREDELPPPPASKRGATPLEIRDRASLGVRLVPLTEDARRRFSVTARSGALIEGIREGSPADRFGLPLGGVIVSLDGRPIDSPDEVMAALRTARPGDEVEVGYYQGEKMFRKLVRLAPAAGATPSDLSPPGVAPAVKKLEGLLDRLVAPPDLGVPRGADDRREVTELRSEVELLKGEIDRLKRKLAELEARLDGEKK